MVRWIGFHILIFILLAVDLLVFRKKEMGWKEALAWTVGWIGLALVFNAYIFWDQGPQKGVEFFTAYLVEKSLSIDNLFIFLVIFSYFKVPADLQPWLLHKGIFGALIFRLTFILAGLSLISAFHFATYIFGAVVGWTGLRMIWHKKQLMIQNSRLLRFLQNHVSITHEYNGRKFLIRKGKQFYWTPLLLALIMIESSDVLFAVDSIPAVLAVTHDVFIAYTSNVFAILGLRSLFFLMAPWFELMTRLKIGLGAILLFIGFKMLLEPLYEIPMGSSLGVIATILLVSTIYSVRKKPK
jgi:tellurite resistance protein TerC